MAQLDLLSKYKGNKNVFIETGTWYGDGITQAIMAGFDVIYTCYVDDQLVERAKNVFAERPGLFILNKKSYIALDEIMSDLQEESLIFLDAHIMPLDMYDESLGFDQRQTELNDGSLECPLIKEIETISKSNIKTHTVLIDDFQCFGTWMFNGLEFETVKEMMLKINPEYKVSIENRVACFYI
jgi:hypothetical protein